MLKNQTDTLPLIQSQGFEYGVKHFKSPYDNPLSAVISQTLNIPSSEAEFLIQLGGVYVEGKRISNPLTHIHLDTPIRVHTKPRRYNVNYDWKAKIIFDHSDFIVLNKPSFIPSHPSVDNQIENALTQTAQALQHPLFITHRLDSLTEGLIVYGKNAAFVHAFNTQLQKKLVTKKYVALVETTEKLPSHLVHYMEPSPRAPKKVSSIYSENWDLCELKIEQQKIFNQYSWIKINLLTGRTHQIRSQMSEIQAPILGDKLYGSQFDKAPYHQDQKIALRAQEIDFMWLGQSHLIQIDEDFRLE